MKRGQLYRVKHPHSRDPKKSRVFVIVSRQSVIDSAFTTVTCAPVYSNYHGLSTQVLVDVAQGLKHTSAIHCDELISLPKSKLTDFIGTLDDAKMLTLNHALKQALALGDIG